MWKLKDFSFKKLSKKNKIITISVSAAVIVVGSIAGAYLYARNSYNNILATEAQKPPAEDTYTPETPVQEEIQDVDYGLESDIVNILLVGVDTRGEFDDSRTDSMIIATVDPKNKKVKLTSLMRDMYVEIPGRGYQKINSAFELGGIELLKKTIKYNFGISLDKYVAIDFKGFQELIDTLDGVELEVKDYEVKEINKYIEDVNGDSSTLLQGPGVQKLNGQQALSYSRIRKVGNNDFERTERQRRVLSLLLSKIKETKVTSYPKLYSTISPYLKTNIEFEPMLKLVYTVYKLDNFTPETTRIPVDNHFKDMKINGAAVLVPDLNYNAKEIFKFIYGTVPGKLSVPNNSKVYNADIIEAEKKKETTTPASTTPQTQTQPPASEQKPAETPVKTPPPAQNPAETPVQAPPPANQNPVQPPLTPPPS
ncbi:LCP family protein [Clostridium sp. YIM B02515]|uniref:LCP family protein n=1 Tax=Clostridium rhizosphaerae TaxID=2803861 RepID=A0ABS1TCI3_9CLOT|nr:LCP family protein [Clostridium rhizosphaerae]MBL4937074.1 LCP family protein [Clostridium rhizosphaerae]